MLSTIKLWMGVWTFDSRSWASTAACWALPLACHWQERVDSPGCPLAFACDLLRL